MSKDSLPPEPHSPTFKTSKSNHITFLSEEQTFRRFVRHETSYVNEPCRVTHHKHKGMKVVKLVVATIVLIFLPSEVSSEKGDDRPATCNQITIVK